MQSETEKISKGVATPSRAGNSLSSWGAASLTRHAGTIRDIAVSRDAGLVASASGDHAIHVCQPALAETGGDADAARTVLRGHRHIVSGVSFSPDGCFLVSCSFDKTLRVWARPAAPVHASVGGDRATETTRGGLQWRLQAVIDGHTDRCVSMHIHPHVFGLSTSSARWPWTSLYARGA